MNKKQHSRSSAIKTELKTGDVYRNNNPYDGEGNIIITDQFDNYGGVLVIHCEHKKHPGMNGMREIKSIESILRYYHKLP